MVEEQGQVVAVEQGFAWVETQRTNACQSCSVNKGCGTGVLGKILGRRATVVKALNHAGAVVNDRVVVGLREDALVKGSLAIYAVPLLAMLAGALLGDALASGWQFDNPDGLAILFAGVGLAGGLLWLKLFSRKTAGDERYQPVVLRRVGAAVDVVTIEMEPKVH